MMRGNDFVGKECWFWGGDLAKEDAIFGLCLSYDDLEKLYLVENALTLWRAKYSCAQLASDGHPHQKHHTDKHAKLDDLREQYAKLGEAIRAIEEAERPALANGQLWRCVFEDDLYIVTMDVSDLGGTLVRLDGKVFSGRGRGFQGMESKFAYLGMADDLLRIDAPKGERK